MLGYIWYNINMLTLRQKQVKDFVNMAISKKGVAPTEREIARRLRISPSTAHEHLTTLQNKGYLEKAHGRARGIKIVKTSTKLVRIPLLGTIAAGQPFGVIQENETIAVPQNKIPSGNIFALKVAGNSMVDENINDGDIVLVRQQATAENGQKVVALIDNHKATLKKFYKERGRIRLQPANKSMEPLIFRNGRDISIQGIVLDIIKQNEQPQVKFNLFSQDPVECLDVNSDYFTSQLITYIGNKRRLLPFLYKGFLKIREKVGKKRLVILDGFVGSGAVARLLKAFASKLYVNDLEDYAETINNAYLTNKSEIDTDKLEKYVNWLNKNKLRTKNNAPGFIEKNYAPKNDDSVQSGERVFYTNTNAKIIDNLRYLIDRIPQQYKKFCLASLLVKASVHTNTSGVFKGFHKRNGNGHFGGNGENALSRIKKEISLDAPIFSEFECPVYTYKRNVNELVQDKRLPIFDLAYFDPPYNQHPYGSNYFMLNIINNGKSIEIQDGISGIAKEWNRSTYNKRKTAEKAMDQLLDKTRARFIAISYNNEGIIPIDNFKKILSRHGKWELMEQDYNTYRGSRNLRDRNIKVRELLWILEKKSRGVIAR